MAVFPITLFGVLQTVHGARVLEIETEVPVAVEALQKAVLARLGGCEHPVALAENHRLLRGAEMLDSGRPLLALPPVCGG